MKGNIFYVGIFSSNRPRPDMYLASNSASQHNPYQPPKSYQLTGGYDSSERKANREDKQRRQDGFCGKYLCYGPDVFGPTIDIYSFSLTIITVAKIHVA